MKLQSIKMVTSSTEGYQTLIQWIRILKLKAKQNHSLLWIFVLFCFFLPFCPSSSRNTITVRLVCIAAHHIEYYVYSHRVNALTIPPHSTTTKATYFLPLTLPLIIFCCSHNSHWALFAISFSLFVCVCAALNKMPAICLQQKIHCFQIIHQLIREK